MAIPVFLCPPVFPGVGVGVFSCGVGLTVFSIVCDNFWPMAVISI